MKRFLPREKLGRKARKELDSQRRVTWQCSPVTRTIDSKKLYDRHRKPREDRYEPGCAGLFFARAALHAIP